MTASGLMFLGLEMDILGHFGLAFKEDTPG